MSKAPAPIPKDCWNTLCPTLMENFILPKVEEGLDPILMAVFALSRKYRTHVITIRESGIDTALCSEEKDKWLDEAVGGIVREVNEAIKRRLACEENVWRNVGSMTPDAVVKALKKCVNELVSTLSKFDENDAKAIGEAHMRSIPVMVNLARKARIDKIDKAADELLMSVKPFYIDLFEKAIAKALGSRGTVVSFYETATARTVLLVEDGRSGLLRLGLMDTVERTYEEFKKLASYYPDVFSLDCGNCPHAALADLVRSMKKEQDFPLLVRLIVWYVLGDRPVEVREKMAESLRTLDDVLRLITAAHAVETGRITLFYRWGNTPICISVLTCGDTKELLDAFIDEVTSGASCSKS